MADTLVNKQVITRKEHQCWGCGRIFPPKSKLNFIKVADGGEILRSYWCDVCSTMWQDMNYRGDDGIDCGDLKDSEPEIWEEYRNKIETERNG